MTSTLAAVLQAIHDYYEAHPNARRGPTHAHLAQVTGLHINTVSRAVQGLAAIRKIERNPYKRRSIRIKEQNQ